MISVLGHLKSTLLKGNCGYHSGYHVSSFLDCIEYVSFGGIYPVMKKTWCQIEVPKIISMFSLVCVLNWYLLGFKFRKNGKKRP